MSVSIQQFVSDLALDLLIIWVPVYATYLLYSFVLQNSAHGAVGSWLEMLQKLTITFRNEDIRQPEGTSDVVAVPPFQQSTMKEMRTVISCHDTIIKAKSRLAFIKNRISLGALSLLYSFFFAFAISAPILFDQPKLTETIPNILTVVATLGSMIFLILISLPQIGDWNRIKDEASPKSNAYE